MDYTINSRIEENGDARPHDQLDLGARYYGVPSSGGDGDEIDSLDRALMATDGSDGDDDSDRESLSARHRRRRRHRGPRLSEGDERRVTVYLIIATILFFAVSIGLGAANYYSPLACFGQRHHIEVVDRAHMRRDHSWIVLASAFFACGTTSLVALGLLVVGAVCCAALSLRVSRALACAF
nr:hypothetical protein [Pandoravirus belohorizontensis]